MHPCQNIIKTDHTIYVSKKKLKAQNLCSFIHWLKSDKLSLNTHKIKEVEKKKKRRKQTGVAFLFMITKAISKIQKKKIRIY